jgi:hypothetical protein
MLDRRTLNHKIYRGSTSTPPGKNHKWDRLFRGVRTTRPNCELNGLNAVKAFFFPQLVFVADRHQGSFTSGPLIRSVDQPCGADLMRLQPVIIFLIQVRRSRTSAVEKRLYPNWPTSDENIDFVQLQYSHD